MHFLATAAYPASAADVAQLFSTPEFVDAQIVASRASEGKKTLTGSAPGAFTVETVRTMPPDMVPSQFRSFVSSGIVLTMKESWQEARADGHRTGTIEVSISGVPARAQGTCTLSPSGADSCELTYEGDLRVSVPLFGGKIEKSAVGAVKQVMELERDLAVDWLKSNR